MTEEVMDAPPEELADEITDDEAAPEADASEGAEPAAEEAPWVVPKRFRTVDDVVRALEEADALIGRQGNEIGELRRVAPAAAEPKAAEPEAQQPDFTQRELALIGSKAQGYISMGLADEAQAYQIAAQEVRAMREMLQERLEPIDTRTNARLQEEAEDAYTAAAQNAVSSLGLADLPAAEIEAALRTAIPMKQWADTPRAARLQMAASLAKIRAFDLGLVPSKAATGEPEPKTTAPTVVTPGGQKAPATGGRKAQLMAEMKGYHGDQFTDAEYSEMADKYMKQEAR